MSERMSEREDRKAKEIADAVQAKWPQWGVARKLRDAAVLDFAVIDPQAETLNFFAECKASTLNFDKASIARSMPYFLIPITKIERADDHWRSLGKLSFLWARFANGEIRQAPLDSHGVDRDHVKWFGDPAFPDDDWQPHVGVRWSALEKIV